MKRLSCLLTLGLTCLSSAALGNGRYPIANQLLVSPSDASRLVLRTTFGLVLSEDGGHTFGWVCEKAAGFVNNEDPPVEVTADGSILVASSQALSVSHDGGCAWEQQLAELSIVDADVDPSQPKRTVAIASLYIDGGTRSGLEESLDDAKTWHTLGADFDGLPATIAVAPSDPQRIYASGTTTSDLTPIISTSDDNGATWKSFPLVQENITVPFLAAIDPKHPEVVYVRAPTALGSDVLVMSHDFGEHFTTLFTAKGGLYGFALSPDGTQVAVGGPSDPLSVASTTDYAFRTVSDVAPLCLKWSEAGLYSCADEAKAGFSLALSKDGGTSFDALFHKPELTLKACPATLDTGKYCPQAWVGQQAVLGIDAGAPGGGASATGGVTSEAPDASVSSGAGSGNATGASGASNAGSAGSSASPASGNGSCAVSEMGARRRAWAVLAGLAFAGALAFRRAGARRKR